jgi:DnaD/phage-associated family protein
MQGFGGFPDGKQEISGIPALFFSELLPQIDHLAELKVTLYCLWALGAQDGEFRYVRLEEVRKDEHFLSGLSQQHDEALRLLDEGFERAVARGTLLHVTVTLASGAEDFYFLNAERGRLAVAAIQNGDWLPGSDLRPIGLVLERPNIFTIYEQNIGALTPLIADQLHDLQRDYSAAWLQEAIQIAVNNNARALNYIIKILERWQREGRSGVVVNSGQSEIEFLINLKKQYEDRSNE